MEVNPDRKPKIEPRRQLAINTDNSPATAAAKPAPNIMPYIPLDLVGTTRWRAFNLSSSRPPYISSSTPAPWRGHSSLATKGINFDQTVRYLFISQDKRMPTIFYVQNNVRL